MPFDRHYPYLKRHLLNSNILKPSIMQFLAVKCYFILLFSYVYYLIGWVKVKVHLYRPGEAPTVPEG